MKRLLSLLLAMAFVFAFAGCEAEKIVENQKEPATESQTTTENESNSPVTDENNTTLQSDDNQDSQAATDETPVEEGNKFISKAKAKQIALSDAGLKDSEIRDYEIELDREQGTYYYEINFEAGGFEYEYDIDANSGKIARKYKEKED